MNPSPYNNSLISFLVLTYKLFAFRQPKSVFLSGEKLQVNSFQAGSLHGHYLRRPEKQLVIVSLSGTKQTDLFLCVFLFIAKHSCSSSQWRCLASEQCINITNVCDGNYDCIDQSDERDTLTSSCSKFYHNFPVKRQLDICKSQNFLNVAIIMSFQLSFPNILTFQRMEVWQAFYSVGRENFTAVKLALPEPEYEKSRLMHTFCSSFRIIMVKICLAIRCFQLTQDVSMTLYCILV